MARFVSSHVEFSNGFASAACRSTKSDRLLAHVLELLAPLGRVAAKRMFGGHGLYCDGVFFGILLDNRRTGRTDQVPA